MKGSEETSTDGLEMFTGPTESQDWYLCYVNELDGLWAWFVDTPNFDELHTDDWDDQTDPGGPYSPRDEGTQYRRLKIPFQTVDQWDSDQKSHRRLSRPRMTPNAINAGEAAWLRETWTGSRAPNVVPNGVKVPARASLETFVSAVREFDGEVFFPLWFCNAQMSAGEDEH